MIKPAVIQFHFQSNCSLPNRGDLKRFLVYIFKKEKRSIKEMSIIFCSDDYLLKLNRQFLDHDFYTDVISFPLSMKNEPLVAEIYISIERVRENAAAIRSSISVELHRVIFHGVLHFCGYKDKSTADIRKMRKKEDQYLKTYL
jgi:rRNA maturation RNase YbeY